MTESVEGAATEISDGLPNGEFTPLRPETVGAPSDASAEDVEVPAAEDVADEVQDAAEQQPDPISELTEAVARLARESERLHQRAAHRETVLDNMHAELVTLRVGERRGTIRPLLVAVARLRDDLVWQASVLPDDFDQVRAQKLLLNFADSVEITLEDFGVVIASPQAGDAFEVRLHKAVGSVPTSESSLVRTIAEVRREGYQDIEAGAPIASAEVIVYVDAPAEPAVDDTVDPAEEVDTLAPPADATTEANQSPDPTTEPTVEGSAAHADGISDD